MTELVVTSAVLIRNCLGVVILVVFVLAGAGPMLHYGVLSLLYRFLSAVSQPISDKRMVSALSAMGEGCTLLLRIVFTAEVLCMLAFLVLMAGIQRVGGQMKAEIYQWVRILATFYILFTAVLQLMPDRKYERYIRSFMGLLLIYMLCTPLFSFLRESREMIGRFRRPL